MNPDYDKQKSEIMKQLGADSVFFKAILDMEKRFAPEWWPSQLRSMKAEYVALKYQEPEEG